MVPDERPVWLSNRLVTIIVVCLLLIIGGQGVQIHQTTSTAHDAAHAAALGVQTHVVVCALRQEDRDNLAALQKAKAEFHPSPGEAKLLDLLIQSRESALAAMGALDDSC